MSLADTRSLHSLWKYLEPNPNFVGIFMMCLFSSLRFIPSDGSHVKDGRLDIGVVKRKWCNLTPNSPFQKQVSQRMIADAISILLTVTIQKQTSPGCKVGRFLTMEDISIVLSPSENGSKSATRLKQKVTQIATFFSIVRNVQ